MKRRSFLTAAALAGGGLSFAPLVRASAGFSPSAVIVWNQAATSAFKTTATGPTVAGRALAMLHEAVYNAWACYVPSASHTLSGLSRRPKAERTDALKTVALSHAAHAVLVDLYPAQSSSFDAAFVKAVAGVDTASSAAVAAARVGQEAADALLRSRANDGSNQRGELAPGAYADWTGYAPVNTPDKLKDPTRWQPLQLTAADGKTTSVQTFLTPHWGHVRPFALASGAALRPVLGDAAPTAAEVSEVIALSAALDDAAKVQVDFWANNPGSVTPPGQWTQFAEMISAHDGNDLDADVRMFFLLGQAMLDASIAAWDAKRAYDSVRPISYIRWLYRKQKISAWGGVGTTGPTTVRGEDWMPYQRVSNPSPNFGEYVSGHSTFSGAAAAVLAAIRGDAFTSAFTLAAGGIRFDPTIPSQRLDFGWSTLSAAAAAAGYSRRLGGIHFERGDLHGRALGQSVGDAVMQRARQLNIA